MHKSKTHFEQVPIDVVKKIAQEFPETKQPWPACPRCGKQVVLETCKIDEDGKAIHAECAVARLVSNHRTEPQSKSASFARPTPITRKYSATS